MTTPPAFSRFGTTLPSITWPHPLFNSTPSSSPPASLSFPGSKHPQKELLLSCSGAFSTPTAPLLLPFHNFYDPIPNDHAVLFPDSSIPAAPFDSLPILPQTCFASPADDLVFFDSSYSRPKRRRRHRHLHEYFYEEEEEEEELEEELEEDYGLYCAPGFLPGGFDAGFFPWVPELASPLPPPPPPPLPVADQYRQIPPQLCVNYGDQGGAGGTRKTRNEGGGGGGSRDGGGEGRVVSASAQSIAAREKRRRITEKTQELGKVVPGGSRMNTAEMLGAAFKYVQFLQSQLRILHFMSSLHQVSLFSLSLATLHCYFCLRTTFKYKIPL